MGRRRRPLEIVVTIAKEHSRPQDFQSAYSGKRVLVTGHTGFKGSWLTLWLDSLGAGVTGFALPPEGERSLFEQADVRAHCSHVEGDIRDFRSLEAIVAKLRPDYVFHLAAQSLVRRSYRLPRETFETNVVGTVNVLEALRRAGSPSAVVVITSDKCYENDRRAGPYTERDPLGGHDPYSASKAGAEIITASYRASFFRPERLEEHGIAVASARSGNVIGGGDWCEDRLVPDAVRALEVKNPIPVRNPRSVRPWQHVLDPLSGYLRLGARLIEPDSDRSAYCEAWNFGPNPDDSRTVSEVVDAIIRRWGSGSWIDASNPKGLHEAAHLTLSIEKARARLSWTPHWQLDDAITRTIDWYRCAASGASPQRLAELCREQIAEHAA
ncbi:MAG: CDP-glucose 4,6-dehydratase [Thermoanaerobaculia bacterium]